MATKQNKKTIKFILHEILYKTNTCKKYFIENGDHHLKKDDIGIILYQKYL